MNDSLQIILMETLPIKILRKEYIIDLFKYIIFLSFFISTNQFQELRNEELSYLVLILTFLFSENFLTYLSNYYKYYLFNFL